MKITIDTSALIAVITNESSKNRIIQLTTDTQLYSPMSVHWEIGNAFSAMIKRKRILLSQAKEAVDEYNKIPIKFIDVELNATLEIVEHLQIYAYDAYLIKCSQLTNSPLLTLDQGLIRVANLLGIKILEV